MKKQVYLWSILSLFVLLSCSSSDDTVEVAFAEIKLEISGNQIHNPQWLKEVIAEQSITSETGTFFPGDIYGVIVDGEKYIVVYNYLSSNSCIALQLYQLNGEAIPCPNELQHKLFTEGLDQYPHTMLWSGMTELD